jgi:phytoene/squalene synthetase
VARARELFRDGAPALTAVHARMRPGMRMAQAVYLAVLDRVEALDYDVLGRSAAVSPWEATGAALAAFWSRA